MLGGINTDSKKTVGAYGRRLMTRLWEEVAATTGQHFSALPAAPYVHNSTLACLAVETVRVITREAPFDYLHKVQEHFFVRGNDVNDAGLLRALAVDNGCGPDKFAALLHSNAVAQSVRFQFEHAGSFGTAAMPSLLIEREGAYQLLAGGYVDAAMLESLLTGTS
jgi:protein-disulfide isomerase-like protein with CxxC motif